MSTAVMPTSVGRSPLADKALKAAAGFWLAVTVVGQFIFAFAVASFYGMTALRGDYFPWHKFISRGHVAGDTADNTAIAAHVASAAIIMFAGSLQLIPQIRNRFPVFHRWNGRIYMSFAVLGGAAGLYLTWVRGTVGDVYQHIGSSIRAVLIFIFAALALRSALARDFIAHRRWALRLFLVVSGAFFIRLILVLSGVIFKGPFGFNPQTFTGPFLTFSTFAQYLVPLAVLEIYFRAQDRPSARNRFAAAGLLFVMTLAMIGGIFAVTLTTWMPQVKAAYDSRKSIAQTLSATIASSGIDQAAQQYHDLKAAQPAAYDFDETELNTLGYDYIRARKFKEAIRILQLNVEAYPKSSNVFDSLGEAYMDDGNKPLAIVNYQKSLELNPKNSGAVVALQKLKAP
jgi:tetratricopeptide (TPR) repeat protein